MQTPSFSFNWKVFTIFVRRYKWLIIFLTTVSALLAIVILRSMLNLYTASATVLVNQDELDTIIEEIAVTPRISNQLGALRHVVLNDQFIQTHIIQKLHLRLQDVYSPPARLPFMTTVVAVLKKGQQLVKLRHNLTGDEAENTEQKQVEQQLAHIIKTHLTLTLQNGNRVLLIAYTGPVPQATKDIVKIAADQCITYLLQTRRQTTSETRTYIKTQYAENERHLAELEQQLAEKRVQGVTQGPEAQIALIQRQQEILDALRETQQTLATLDRQKKDLLIAKENHQIALLLDDAEFLKKLAEIRHPLGVTLETKEADLKRFLETYTREWPAVKQLEQEIDALKQEVTPLKDDQQIREQVLRTDQIYNQYVGQLTQLETEEESLQTAAQNYEERLKIYEDKLKQMPEFQKSLVPIQREIELYSQLLLELATQREKIQRAEDLQRKLPQISIISTTTPELTGIPQYLVGIVVFSFGPIASISLIGLLYYHDTSIKHPDDVAHAYNLPVLAIIPRAHCKLRKPHFASLVKSRKSRFQSSQARKTRYLLESTQSSNEAPHAVSPVSETGNALDVQFGEQFMKRIPITDLPRRNWGMLTTLSHPNAQITEEYQRLCFKIEMKLKEMLAGACQSLLVTSALVGEGKTSTACNLAVTLAREQQVLLLDLNFRHPTVHSTFGIPGEPGVAELVQQNRMPQLFTLSDRPNLSILPAGKVMGNPSELFHSIQMTRFLETMKHSASFQYVVIDMPAVLPFPDVAMTAAKMDGILWIIRELGSTRDIIRSALVQVAYLPILGVVLNASEQQILYPAGIFRKIRLA